MSHMNSKSIAADERTGRLETLMDDLGWGVLLIVTGVLWLIPSGGVPSGTWLMVAGFVILIFNTARHIHGLPVSGFAVVAGLIALVAGAGEALSISLPLIPIALIVVGVCMFLASEEGHRSKISKGQDQSCC
jgi:hypothetical protein